MLTYPGGGGGGGRGDRVVLDQSVNCGDSRELLSNTCDLTGIAGGPNVMSIALA